MFGYTLPHKLVLTLKDNYQYKAHYCGVCGALKKQHFLFRFLTGYEATLLAILIDAQKDAPPQQTKLFCPFSGERGRMVVMAGEQSVSFAALATLLMGYYKLNDLKRDNKKLALVFKPCEKGFKKAKLKLTQGGLPVTELDRLELSQTLLEQKAALHLDDLLMPTGKALALIFRYTAFLADCNENSQNLSALGEALGKLIYLLDCLEDWPKDKRLGRFNGLAATGIFKNYDLEDLKYITRRLFYIMETSLKNLKLKRYGLILENILCLALPVRCEQKLNLFIKQLKS